MNPQHQQKRIIRQSCHHKFYPQPLFNFSYNRPTFAFTSESGHTLGSRRKIAHNGSHGETGAFRTGPLSLPSDCFTRFGNPAWPDVRTAYFAAFESWPGVLPKKAESLGTAMRLCASLSRGVAAPLDCVILSVSVEIAACMPCAQGFPRVRDIGGITTLSALCVLLKRRTAACQKGSFAIFRGQVIIIVFSAAKRALFFWHSSSLRQTAPVPCERNRGCFCVTSCNDTGRLRFGRGCKRRWDRNVRRPRRR